MGSSIRAYQTSRERPGCCKIIIGYGFETIGKTTKMKLDRDSFELNTIYAEHTFMALHGLGPYLNMHFFKYIVHDSFLLLTDKYRIVVFGNSFSN